MKLKNDFPTSVRELYRGVWRCWLCKANGSGRGGLEIHHILGRSSKTAFNSSCLCGECHRHIGHSRQEHQKIFAETLKFLKDLQYKPSEADWEFLQKNFDELVGEDALKWLN